MCPAKQQSTQVQLLLAKLCARTRDEHCLRFCACARMRLGICRKCERVCVCMAMDVAVSGQDYLRSAQVCPAKQQSTQVQLLLAKLCTRTRDEYCLRFCACACAHACVCACAWRHGLAWSQVVPGATVNCKVQHVACGMQDVSGRAQDVRRRASGVGCGVRGARRRMYGVRRGAGAA